jgi:hypothetical protein
MDCPKRETRAQEAASARGRRDRATGPLRVLEMQSASTPRPAAEAEPLDPFTARLAAREAARANPPAAHLRCVSSGYPSHGGHCGATVPEEVATAAWEQERQDCLVGDRFFQFSWRGEAWLAFGVDGKGVRGVYCPAHSAERTKRSFMQLLARNASGEETFTAA